MLADCASGPAPPPFQAPDLLLYCLQPLTFDPVHLSILTPTVSPPPQGDRMDREAMKCQVLTVSNHSCESLTLVGNTLECTVPTELQTTTSKELQVEVRGARTCTCS